MLIYPAIVVVGMIIVSGIMAFFVIPRLTPLFSEVGASLPLPTKIVIFLAEFTRNYWWLILAVFGFAFWGGVRLAKLPKIRDRLDEQKLKIPIIGPLAKKMILTEMARTLGLLTGAGVAILDALKIISGVVGNTYIRQAVDRAAIEVEKGFALSTSFAANPDIFPPLLTHMMAVGEETGRLDQMLLKISQIFEQETDQAVRNLTATIGPLITVVLAIGVGILALAVFLPIYQLPQAVGR
jgi:type II secretory pathway component PulF